MRRRTLSRDLGSYLPVYLLFAGLFAPALADEGRAQALGAEAYFYRDLPLPAHVVADSFIERAILPKLEPAQLPSLWAKVKNSPQSLNSVLDTISRRSPANDDVHQTYLRYLLLLRHLRDAIITYEQLPLTPESYAAFFGENGFPPVTDRANYLAKAKAFTEQRDNPQKAALKAAVSLVHEQDRRSGAPVFECHFENPSTQFQPFCTQQIGAFDGLFRDMSMARRYPLDDQRVKLLAPYTNLSEEMIRNRLSLIDVIARVLLQGDSYRVRRNGSIQNALGQSEQYRAALRQRQSQLPAVQRSAAAQDPLDGLVRMLGAAAGTIFVLAQAEQSARAERNAANPEWKGHEKDEWCQVDYDYYYDNRSFAMQSEMITYCYAYNGFMRTPTRFDRCHGVEGWCSAK